jgi:hypothetical protein
MRLLGPGMRRLLFAAGVLVFAAGIQLFVFTERTATRFAWTIEPPLTAAFLGASYWASVALEWTAARERVWARARVAAPAVFVFTTLTLVATLLHIDRFHLGERFAFSTQLVTWVWIAVYALVPPLMAVLMVVQRRITGADPSRSARLPRWLRAVLIAEALLLGAVGAGLFAAPERTSALWPWALTPLTARAVGAWLVGIGIAAAHSASENDFRRVRPAAVSYVLLGVLHGVVVARYPDQIEWGVGAWVYVAIIALSVVVGVYAWGAASRLESRLA